MQNPHLLEFLAEAFRCYLHYYQYLSNDSGAHGTEKLLLKTQLGEDFA